MKTFLKTQFNEVFFLIYVTSLHLSIFTSAVVKLIFINSFEPSGYKVSKGLFNQISLIKIIDNKGPTNDPCETPDDALISINLYPRY